MSFFDGFSSAFKEAWLGAPPDYGRTKVTGKFCRVCGARTVRQTWTEYDVVTGHPIEVDGAFDLCMRNRDHFVS